MTGHPLWAVVPVKRFGAAKMRLANVLSGEDRSALAEAMMRDVLSAAVDCTALAGIVVVTCDRNAAQIAAAAGANVVQTASDSGHSPAAEAGVAALGGRASSVLLLSADIPLVGAEDIAFMASLHRPAPSVTLARAASDAGTNALLVSPPDIIGFRFGFDSEARHIEAARQVGASLRSLTVPRMAYDIDRAEDLGRFLKVPSPTLTYRLLADLKARGRLSPQRLSPHAPAERMPLHEGEPS